MTIPCSEHFAARARLLAKVYEIDPLVCPKCGGEMKAIAVIQDPVEIRDILAHLAKTGRAPPTPSRLHSRLAPGFQLLPVSALRNPATLASGFFFAIRGAGSPAKCCTFGRRAQGICRRGALSNYRTGWTYGIMRMGVNYDSHWSCW